MEDMLQRRVQELEVENMELRLKVSSQAIALDKAREGLRIVAMSVCAELVRGDQVRDSFK
jgi:predicted ATPase